MELQYYGANCVVLSSKDSRVVIDDTLASVGAKSITRPGDVALFTGMHKAPSVETRLTVQQPGEYEVSNVSIVGIPTRAHMDEVGEHSATMYKVVVGEMSFLFTGHVYPEFTDDQLEAIGIVDVMIVPVGGNGYTLDAIGALKLIKEVEPKVIIPTHYDEKGLQFEVPQQTLKQAVHDLAMEPKEVVAKLKLKPAELAELTQLIILERS
jgi:L-ascorbate metabolism protein UlaG (beta-lactamase superfamily)